MQRIFMVLAGLPVFMSTAVAQQQPQPLAAPLCAAAVEAGCQCAVLLPSQAGGIAQVTGTEGTVLVTRGASAPVDAAQSEVLSASDRVITGEASNAELLVASSCNLSVPAQSIVTFSSIEGCACATVTSNTGQAGAQGEGTGGGGGGVLLGAGTGLALTTIPGFLDGDEEGDGDASPEER